MPGEETIRKRPALNPYVAIACSVVLDAGSQVFLKIGSTQSVSAGSIVGIQGLGSGWVWIGIVTMVLSFTLWIYSLRHVPLNIAANLTGAVHVLVPLISLVALHEQIHAKRWFGISLVIIGVLVIARPLMKAEEKMEGRA
ncbi:MAG TPA: EamA family transporter [Chthoniobacteraceae bacterium]|nr:EamA family transporter [Chthoniobacteraceae bacterium]